jgi:hypothetical protein
MAIVRVHRPKIKLKMGQNLPKEADVRTCFGQYSLYRLIIGTMSPSWKYLVSMVKRLMRGTRWCMYAETGDTLFLGHLVV